MASTTDLFSRTPPPISTEQRTAQSMQVRPQQVTRLMGSDPRIDNLIQNIFLEAKRSMDEGALRQEELTCTLTPFAAALVGVAKERFLRSIHRGRQEQAEAHLEAATERLTREFADTLSPPELQRFASGDFSYVPPNPVEREERLKIAEFVEEFNGNYEERERLREEAIDRMRLFYGKALDPQKGPNALRPNQVPHCREAIRLLCCCRDEIIQAQGMQLLYFLIEHDPLEGGSHFELIIFLEQLNLLLESPEFVAMGKSLKRRVSRVFHTTVEVVLLHGLRGNLDNIPASIRTRILTKAEHFKTLHNGTDYEISYHIEGALQAAKRLVDNSSIGLIPRIAHVVHAGVNIYHAYDDPNSAIPEVLEAISHVRQALYGVFGGDDWYDTYLVFNKLIRAAHHRSTIFDEIKGLVMSSQEDIEKVDQNLLFGIVLTLEEAVKTAGDWHMREELMKLILQYINVPIRHIQARVIRALTHFMLSPSLHTRDVSLVALEIIRAAKIIPPPEEAIDDEERGNLEQIVELYGRANPRVLGWRVDPERVENSSVLRFLIRRLGRIRDEGEGTLSRVSLIYLATLSKDNHPISLLRCLAGYLNRSLHKVDELGTSLLHLIVRAGNVFLLEELRKRGIPVRFEICEEGGSRTIPFRALSLWDERYLSRRLGEIAERFGGEKNRVPTRNGVSFVVTMPTWSKAIGALILKEDVGIPLDARDYRRGYTALHYAVVNGSTADMRALGSLGASFDIGDNNGRPPLHLAASLGFVDACHYIMDNEHMLNAEDDQGDSPLNCALLGEKPATIDLLLNRHAKVTPLEMGQTPILFAARRKCEGSLRHLIESGHPVSAQEALEIQDLLVTGDLELGCHPDFARFHCNRLINNPEYATAFRPFNGWHRPHINQTGEIVVSGNSPLQDEIILAAQQGDLPAVRRLEDRLSTRDLQGNSVLHNAVEYADPTRSSALITYLTEKSQESINSRNHLGITPLLMAVWCKNRRAIETLLDAGADPMVPDLRGFTILHIAAANGYRVVLEQLKESLSPATFKALLEARNCYGDTPVLTACGVDRERPPCKPSRRLRIATDRDGASRADFSLWRKEDKRRGGDPDTISLLIDSEADISAADNMGNGALHRAARFGSGETVAVLLRLAAARDFWRENHRGAIPLEEAFGSGFLDPILVLIGESGQSLAELQEKFHEKTDCRFATLAAARGFYEILEKLLELHPELVHTTDRHHLGKTPLHLAAERGDATMVNLLLLHGAKVDARDRFKDTPLHLASAHLHYDVADLLITNGAEPSSLDQDGYSAAFSAIVGYPEMGHDAATVQGQKEVVKLLIGSQEREEDPSSWYSSSYSESDIRLIDFASLHGSDSKSNSALHLAARAGHHELLRWLIEKGCARNERNDDGRFPLHVAAEGGHEACVRVLLQGLERKKKHEMINGQDYYGDGALHLACRGKDNIGLINLLIQQGGDVTLNNRKRETPLHTAAHYHHAEAVAAFIDRAAQQELAEEKPFVNWVNDSGRTPLHLVVDRWFGTYNSITDHQVPFAILDRLHEAGADVNVQDHEGRTPFHLVVIGDDDAYVDYFLAPEGPWLANLDLSIADQDGNRALHHAAMLRRSTIIRKLFGQRKVGLNDKNKRKETALHVAARHAATHIIIALRDAGADRNKHNLGKQTPLHLAAGCEESQHDIVALLTQEEKGVINEFDINGDSILHVAAANGHEEIVRHVYANLPFSSVKKARDFIFKKNNNGKRAWKVAEEARHFELALLLKAPEREDLILEEEEGCCCTVS